jgi:phage-related protein (TIGR01555 family)
MSVTRYKRQQATAENIREAVLGVMRKKSQPEEMEAVVEAKPAKPIEPKEPMRISARVRARTAAKKNRGSGEAALIPSYFKAYEPPPTVLPQGGKPAMALDSALEGWAQTSFTNAINFANPYGEMFSEGLGFLGYAYLSQLTQRPEYRRFGEKVATEMTRKWIRLTISGEADPKDETADDDDDKGLATDDKATIAVAKKSPPDAPLEDEDAEEEAALTGTETAQAAEEDEEPTPEEKAQRAKNKKLRRKLKLIEEDMKRLDVRGKFKTVAEFDAWMGRMHLYIDTGDGDDPEELLSDLGNGSDETSRQKFKKGSLRNIKPIEPIWCYPVRYNANDPLADDWYNPQIWFSMAKQIHASRLLTFVGRPVPDILKPSYAFGGLSMSQMAKPYVDNWLRTRQAVTNLIESFSVSGVYTNAQSLLQGGGEEVLDRIEVFNNERINTGTMVLDKDTEEFFNVSTPLGTLDQLQAQSQEQLSSVSGIPLVVLLGISPHGLNASSEGELRVHHDSIHAMQESLFRDKLHRVICFIQLNLFGEVDPAIGFEFVPLWSLDEKGEAEVRKTKAETHQIYVDMGVIGQEEIRAIEIEDDDSPYNGLDPDDLPEPPAEAGIMGPGAGGAAKEFEAEHGPGGGMSDPGDDNGRAMDSMGAVAKLRSAIDAAFTEFAKSGVKLETGIDTEPNQVSNSGN